MTSFIGLNAAISNPLPRIFPHPWWELLDESLFLSPTFPLWRRRILRRVLLLLMTESLPEASGVSRLVNSKGRQKESAVRQRKTATMNFWNDGNFCRSAKPRQDQLTIHHCWRREIRIIEIQWWRLYGLYLDGKFFCSKSSFRLRNQLVLPTGMLFRNWL